MPPAGRGYCGTLYERSKNSFEQMAHGDVSAQRLKEGHEHPPTLRMLGASVKSTWFMMHRIREGLGESDAGPLGRHNKVVEADETHVGGKAKNKAFSDPPKKEPVVALVERDGKVMGRAVIAAKDIQGKRLTYRRTSER